MKLVNNTKLISFLHQTLQHFVSRYAKYAQQKTSKSLLNVRFLQRLPAFVDHRARKATEDREVAPVRKVRKDRAVLSVLSVLSVKLAQTVLLVILR
jgi:hypothetical protein